MMSPITEILEADLRIISPVQYYSTQSARGTRTSPFLGDIALTYSMAHQLGDLPYPPYDRRKPEYGEIKSLGYLFTVGVPESLWPSLEWTPAYMKHMFRNTMLGIDHNGTSADPYYTHGSFMYKNFFFVQPLKPDLNLSYKAYLILFNKFEKNIPETLRIGNGKTGMVSVRVSKSEGNVKFPMFLNQYTVENIYGKKLPLSDYRVVYNQVNQYRIVGPVEESKLYSIFS